VKKKNNKIKVIFCSGIITILVVLMTIAVIYGFCTPEQTMTCQVKFVNGESEEFIQTYNKGDKLKFPDNPTKNGYKFVGWYLDEKQTTIISKEIVVEKPLTLYAK